LFKFDLGEQDGTNSFRHLIDEICGKDENEPIIMVLDEFQHSRTLKGPMNTEVEKDNNRNVWELIDSGKIEYFNWYISLSNLSDYVNKLKQLVLNGVGVENGMITGGLDLYHAEFNKGHRFGIKNEEAPNE